MKPWPRFALLTASLLPLSACALWTDFKLPQAEMPKDWKGQEAAKPDAKSVWPDVEWWKAFHSDALTAQIEQASKENFDIKAAVARVREADAQLRINGAALLPSINASGAASRDRSAGTTRAHVANSYNAKLNASYELDFWGKNYAAEESARQLAQASRYDQETVALTASSSVADNYFDILATQERLQVARDNLKSVEELLDAIRKRFAAGIVTALDVAQEENLVATQKAAIPPLELHLQQDMDAQGILLGKLPENVYIKAAKLSDIAIPEITAGIPSELLQRRPDVQNAEAQLASAHADIINARAQFFPSIGLTAQGGYESAALAQLFKPESLLWSLGSSLAQPIFEGGQLSGQLELRKARYDELLQDYRKSALSAFSDVEDALASLRHNDEEEKAQAATVDTARKAYALTQQQFTGGVVDITTVLNTQRALFSAQDALVQARLAHLQAIVGLYKALGGGWKIEGTVAPSVLPG